MPAAAPDVRPDPDALLRRMAEDARTEPADQQARRARAEGRLKVFLGASPGVGKTYEMLREALDRQAQGVDVVAGYVEPHGRAETERMLVGLEVLPFRELPYKGITLREFDLDGARARKPQLVLVDELAHTNAEGSRHKKRWQDVLELLRHGIDVYTTVNVQHVESLRDVVASITGVVQKETVPDGVFDRADLIELVDIPPDELLARLAAGKIYVPDRAREAAQRFFRVGNLTALRQVALRFVADHVDRRMEVYRQAEPSAPTWAARERLVVALSAAPSAERLVRAAKRMADRLGAPWTALHVEPTTGLSDAARARVQSAFALAERLGGRTATLVSDRPVDELLAFARRENATRLVVGPPTHPRWQDRLRTPFLDALVRGAGDGLDVLVTSGKDDDAPTGRAARAARRASPAWAYAAAAGAVAAVAAANLLLLDFELVNVAMFLLATVVVVAARLGRGPTVLATALSLAAFNFFFVPPRFTFEIAPEYLVTFGAMGFVAALVAGLTLRVRASADAARARERRTDALFRLGRDLVASGRTADVLRRGVLHLAETFDAHVVALLPGEDGRLEPVIAHGGPARLDAKEAAVAAWTYANRRAAGRGTDTLPNAGGRFVPLAAGERALGVVALYRAAPFDADEAHHLEAFANPIALALLRSDLRAWIGGDGA